MRAEAYYPLRNIDKVDATMGKINEQREIADEIAEAISNPAGAFTLDEVRSIFLN